MHMDTGLPSPKGPVLPLPPSFLISRRNAVRFSLVTFSDVSSEWALWWASQGGEWNFPGKLSSNAKLVVVANVYGECFTVT